MGKSDGYAIIKNLMESGDFVIRESSVQFPEEYRSRIRHNREGITVPMELMQHLVIEFRGKLRIPIVGENGQLSYVEAPFWYRGKVVKLQSEEGQSSATARFPGRAAEGEDPPKKDPGV